MEKKAKVLIFILILITVGLASSVNQKEPLETSSEITLENPLVMVLSFDYEDRFTDTGTKNLPSIYHILEKHDAAATFFIMGETAKENPNALKEIYSRGYSLGLHSSTHHFPIFSKDDALEIEKIYKTETDYVWDRSFRTPGAFHVDLVRNKRYVTNAIGDNIELKMFRSPSLVINWTKDPEYFSTLKKAGIVIDSSVIRESTDNKPVYTLHGIVEVPVSVSEIRLSNLPRLDVIIEEYSTNGLPFVMYIHPQRLTPSNLTILDEFLSSVEEKYRVTYLKVDEVPTYYGMSYPTDYH